MTLTDQHCQPCAGIGRTVTADEAARLAPEVPGWTVQAQALERTVVCQDFRAALDFVARVGAIAEAEDHHPDIFLHGYKRVRLTLATHALGGLTRNDFIVAAKISAVVPD